MYIHVLDITFTGPMMVSENSWTPGLLKMGFHSHGGTPNRWMVPGVTPCIGNLHVCMGIYYIPMITYACIAVPTAWNVTTLGAEPHEVLHLCGHSNRPCLALCGANIRPTAGVGVAAVFCERFICWSPEAWQIFSYGFEIGLIFHDWFIGPISSFLCENKLWIRIIWTT